MHSLGFLAPNAEAAHAERPSSVLFKKPNPIKIAATSYDSYKRIFLLAGGAVVGLTPAAFSSRFREQAVFRDS
jgi:hypothetical protein